jgi:hypothetical protein
VVSFVDRAVLLAVLTCVWSARGGQVAPRDQNPRIGQAQHGTAVIRGRVVDAETGEPVSRIPVLLAGEDLPPDTVVMSDQEGRFEFGNLRGGTYSLAAETSPSRPRYLGAVYRDAQDGAAAGRRRGRITLRDGEVREDVRLLLGRARVIAGRVFDEAGDPIANVQVRVELLEGQPGGFSHGAETNDLGAFRLFGLPAGRYRVCAFPHPHTVSAIAALRSGIVRTCYPSTVMEAESAPIDVAGGDAEIEIRLQRHRLFTISGIVLDLSGAPADHADIELVRYEKDGSSGRGLNTQHGRFTVHGVAPGDYGLVARVGNFYNLADKRERLVGFVPLRIDSSDIEDIVVHLVRPASIRGRVTAGDGSVPPMKGLAVRAWPDAETNRIQAGPLPEAAIEDDLTFQLKDLYGRYTLQVESLPDGWIVGSIRYRGQEILELPTEFQFGSDPRELQIVLSNRPARMIARVLDDRGSPTEDAIVLLLRADQRFWSGQTHLRLAYPQRGAHEYSDIPPGEYYVVALEPEDVPSPTDLERLKALCALGQRVTFLENDHRTIDLPLVKPAR